MSKERVIVAMISGTACVAMAALTLIGATDAYLASHSSKQNNYTVGKNEISIDEKFDPVTAQQNMTYTKDVTVSNTGDVPCYVRVFLQFSDSDVRDVSQVSRDGNTFETWDDFVKDTSGSWKYIASSTDKTLGGYFYYTKPLQPGESTSSLLKTVKTDFASADDVKPYDVIVYSESVQTVSPDADGHWTDQTQEADNYQTVWKSYAERATAVNTKGV